MNRIKSVLVLCLFIACFYLFAGLGGCESPTSPADEKEDIIWGLSFTVDTIFTQNNGLFSRFHVKNTHKEPANPPWHIEGTFYGEECMGGDFYKNVELGNKSGKIDVQLKYLETICCSLQLDSSATFKVTDYSNFTLKNLKGLYKYTRN